MIIISRRGGPPGPNQDPPASQILKFLCDIPNESNKKFQFRSKRNPNRMLDCFLWFADVFARNAKAASEINGKQRKSDDTKTHREYTHFFANVVSELPTPIYNL